MSSIDMARRRDKPTIRDARGRRVTALDPVELRLRRRYDLIDRDTLRTIGAEVGSGLRSKQKGLLWVLLIGAIICFLAFVAESVDLVVSGRTGEIFEGGNMVFLQLWFWGIVIWAAAKRRRRVHVRRAMLRHRRCPHCGYDLTGLRPDEDDGTTACPECGCAWRVPAGEANGA